jgi:hypothetical protein
MASKKNSPKVGKVRKDGGAPNKGSGKDSYGKGRTKPAPALVSRGKGSKSPKIGSMGKGKSCG